MWQKEKKHAICQIQRGNLYNMINCQNTEIHGGIQRGVSRCMLKDASVLHLLALLS